MSLANLPSEPRHIGKFHTLLAMAAVEPDWVAPMALISDHASLLAALDVWSPAEYPAVVKPNQFTCGGIGVSKVSNPLELYFDVSNLLNRMDGTPVMLQQYQSGIIARFYGTRKLGRVETGDRRQQWVWGPIVGSPHEDGDDDDDGGAPDNVPNDAGRAKSRALPAQVHAMPPSLGARLAAMVDIGLPGTNAVALDIVAPSWEALLAAPHAFKILEVNGAFGFTHTWWLPATMRGKAAVFARDAVDWVASRGSQGLLNVTSVRNLPALVRRVRQEFTYAWRHKLIGSRLLRMQVQQMIKDDASRKHKA